MEYLEKAKGFYQYLESLSDPRVADWPLIPTPFPMFSMALFYILFCTWLGPKLMKNREPFNIRLVLIFYNAAMTILNFHIFKELIVGAVDAGYSFPCHPLKVSNDPKDIRIASAIWWYFISKPVEFLDTIFFVVRKKNDQVTFLHIYHHVTMPCLWWVGVKWVPGGMTTFPPIYNAFIHIIMYTYYGIAACGPQYQKYLWWKKYLTQLQLIQFCIALIHAVYGWYIECPFVNWMYFGLVIYMISFLILFGNFYLQAYIKRRRLGKTTGLRNEKLD